MLSPGGARDAGGVRWRWDTGRRVGKAEVTMERPAGNAVPELCNQSESESATSESQPSERSFEVKLCHPPTRTAMSSEARRPWKPRRSPRPRRGQGSRSGNSQDGEWPKIQEEERFSRRLASGPCPHPRRIGQGRRGALRASWASAQRGPHLTQGAKGCRPRGAPLKRELIRGKRGWSISKTPPKTKLLENERRFLQCALT